MMIKNIDKKRFHIVLISTALLIMGGCNHSYIPETQPYKDQTFTSSPEFLIEQVSPTTEPTETPIPDPWINQCIPILDSFPEDVSYKGRILLFNTDIYSDLYILDISNGQIIDLPSSTYSGTVSPDYSKLAYSDYDGKKL